VVLVDEMVLVVLGGGRGRGKTVSAKVVARQVLAVVVGRSVVNVLCLVTTAALLRNINVRNIVIIAVTIRTNISLSTHLNFVEKEILVGQCEYHLLHPVSELLHDSLVL